MKQNDGAIIGGIFVCLGVLIIIHHVWICGRLFDLADMLHHEFFEAILLTAGITLLIATRQQSN